MEAIKKALANCEQNLSAAEQAQCRANIGAQAQLTAGTNVTIDPDQNVISATDTTYNVFNTTTDGLVPKSNSDTGKFLKGDGTWDTPTDTTYNVFTTSTDGLVPKASGTGDTDKFLKGDGTWGSPLTSVTATAPLAGTGTSNDPLVLHITNGLSLVTPSGGTTALQVTHPVPAPASGDNGKFLKTDSLGNFSWDTPAGASTVKKLDYGDMSASTVSTLLIDSDDADGYAILKCDNVNKGALVVGPYKGLLDSGINGGSGKGADNLPLYIDGNSQFATCTRMPKRSHTAELYFHHSQDGDHYNVRNVKNGCVNHVAVTGHLGDICYIEIEAPTLDGTGEEYDYVVVFDCTNSSGSTKHVVVQNADPEIFTYPLDTASNVVQLTQTMVYFDGSIRSQIEVLGGRFTVHSY